LNRDYRKSLIVPDIESPGGASPPQTQILKIPIYTFFSSYSGQSFPSNKPMQRFTITNSRFLQIYNRSRHPFYLQIQPLNGTSSIESILEAYERHIVSTDFGMSTIIFTLLDPPTSSSEGIIGPISASIADTGDTYLSASILQPSGTLYVNAVERVQEYRTTRVPFVPRINSPQSSTDGGSGTSLTCQNGNAGGNGSPFVSSIVVNPGPSNVVVTFTLGNGVARSISVPAGTFTLPVEAITVAIAGQTGATLIAFSGIVENNF
jgi:hypothetical protein